MPKFQCKWGIASAGKISNDFVAAIKSLPSDEHEVVAIAAREKEHADEFAKKYSIKHSYGSYFELTKNNDIQIVYIGGINTVHFDVAKLMLENGKHVLCEKPLCLNTKQTTELISLAKEKKLFLMEGIWSRFFPLYQRLREELEKGTIGEVVQVIASMGFEIDCPRLKLKKLGGGTILDLGVYLLQLVTLVYGSQIPSSISSGGIINQDGVDEHMYCVLDYDNKKIAMLTSSSVYKLSNCAHIIGTKGDIKICEPFWKPTKMYVNQTEINCPLPKSDYQYNFGGGLMYEASYVRDCLMKGMIECPLITHHDSIILANLEDTLRKQTGVVFPED